MFALFVYNICAVLCMAHIFKERSETMESNEIDFNWGLDNETDDDWVTASDNVFDNWVNPNDELQFRVQKVEPCGIDSKLYEEKYWDKAVQTLLKKNVKAEVYNEIKEVYGNYKALVNDIYEGNFSWGIPKKILIPKDNGKKRTVYMFGTKQRLLLGVMNRILCDVFSDKVSSVCYSYKTGVSTITAVRDIKSKAYSSKNVYNIAMKMDISKYFNSVKADRVAEMLDTLFAESKGVIYELLKTLFSVNLVNDAGTICEEYLSIIPGTPVASFFANYCLYDLDEHFRTLGVPYARYCDDILLFGYDNNEIQGYISYINGILEESGLYINNDKFCEYWLNSADVEFLGLRFGASEIDIAKTSLKKLKKKIKQQCKEARMRVWKYRNPALGEVQRVINWFNYTWYKCYIFDRTKFGWGYYAFRYITTDKSLRELDYYLRDMLRYIVTGKYNRANVKKLSNEKLNELGYVSLTYMYGIFRSDYAVYVDTISRL